MPPVIAALYIDPRGPYPGMAGVDCWDETRDARRYEGPHPVVAHPPCGPWGRLAARCTGQDAALGPLAVEQVRRWGGVLEHPADSRLWRHARLPMPGELPDDHGGFTVRVDQVSWGHASRKPTWLYVVGVRRSDVEQGIRTGGAATHAIWYGAKERARGFGLRVASKAIRRRTPPAFAAWLVELARAAQLSRSP